ncbi:MAG: hypothetical protein ABIK98_05850 [Pseudomonadota bacterium]|nr:hypothetical protein [Pseudomonadota bacterium]
MPAPVYRQRDPQSSPYYRCVEDHFEMFEQVYDDRFERHMGSIALISTRLILDHRNLLVFLVI